MDTASSLIGLGLLLVFVGPIILLIVQQNLKENKRNSAFQKISNQVKIQPEIIDFSASLLLGLDQKTKKLLVVEPENNMQFQLINLQDVRTSEVSTREIPGKQAKFNHISLDLFGKNGNGKISEIIFYDEDDNLNNDAETQLVLAQKWQKLLNTA